MDIESLFLKFQQDGGIFPIIMPLEVKADAGDQFEAVLSRTGVVDRQNEMLVDGSLTDGVKALPGGEMPMYFEHSVAMPIGRWTNVRMDGNDLKADGELFVEEDDVFGRQARSLLRKGRVQATSIGFRVKSIDDLKMVKRDGRIGFDILKAAPREASLVENPANVAARITRFKSEWKAIMARQADGELDFEKAIRDGFREIGTG